MICLNPTQFSARLSLNIMLLLDMRVGGVSNLINPGGSTSAWKISLMDGVLV